MCHNRRESLQCCCTAYLSRTLLEHFQYQTTNKLVWSQIEERCRCGGGNPSITKVGPALQQQSRQRVIIGGFSITRFIDALSPFRHRDWHSSACFEHNKKMIYIGANVRRADLIERPNWRFGSCSWHKGTAQPLNRPNERDRLDVPCRLINREQKDFSMTELPRVSSIFRRALPLSFREIQNAFCKKL